MDAQFLNCPKCTGALQSEVGKYICRACSAEYGIEHGVPLLISGISARPSNFELSPDLINQILSREHISDESSNRDILQKIFAKNYQLQNFLLTAENNFYLKRIGLVVEGYRQQASEAEAAITGRVDFDFKFHMIPDVLPPNELRSWNVRFENTGERTINCRGEFPFYLTYVWHSEQGEILPLVAERTTFPVNIAGGQGITIPLWINPPPVNGRYVLEVSLAQDAKNWSSEKILTVSVGVDPSWNSMVPSTWLTLHRTPDTYNYQIDHEIGRVFLKEELALGGHAYERVLEIGGCCNPMTWDLPCQVISADIDVQTLQVGALHFSKVRPNIEFIAADAHRLPFVDGTFDCAVMFATLHHFLNPAACLRELSRVVKPDGFVAILCEPIGSYRAETLSAEFKADLEEGINEQIFTPEEYGQIFASAGLATSRAMIDGGSFKAILRRVKLQAPNASPELTHAAADLAPSTPRRDALFKRVMRRLARL